MSSTNRGASATRTDSATAWEASRREQLADFAELVLGVARTISSHIAADGDLIHLTATEVNVMRYVSRYPGVMPKDAAEGVGLQRSNFSAALRSLKERGMVETLPDANDRRSMRLFPTERSRRNLERLRILWAELLATALPDPADVRGCSRVLEGIESALGAKRRASSEDPARPEGRSGVKRNADGRSQRDAGGVSRRRPVR